jgi:DNA modification methylase
LRDYGTPPQVWGGDPDCRHRWGAEGKSGQRLRNGLGGTLDGATVADSFGETLHPSTGAFCQRCGAWRGSLGLEPTYQLYIDHLVAVLREVRRVLRPDGTLWLVIGDCYATGGGKAHKAGGGRQGERWPGVATQPNRMPQPRLKPKDLVGIPWRVAFALQDDGWWLRRDNVWSKPNPMPESTKDRCTSSHEYLFHLSKSERYYFDHVAIKEPFADRRNGNPGCYTRTSARSKGGWNADGSADGRHKRSVWTIATVPFPGAHFATYPPALVEPCIMAGTSERGVCSHCGAPWRRVVRRVSQAKHADGKTHSAYPVGSTANRLALLRQAARANGGEYAAESKTIGWRASCDCPGTDPVPAIVLDPFLGAGTTALVADRLGRDCIGLELSAGYAAMARRRVGSAAPLTKRAA